MRGRVFPGGASSEQIGDDIFIRILVRRFLLLTGVLLRRWGLLELHQKFTRTSMPEWRSWFLERGCPDSRQSEEAAARELLRSRAGYSPRPTTVETFRPGSVSLPDSVVNSPLLVDVLSEKDRALVEGFGTHMLSDTSDMMEVHDYVPEVCPYMDAGFREDPRLYAEFICDLFGRGLVAFTRRVRCMNGLFFVGKKGNKQRMIVDAKPANRLFRRPPGVYLAGPESFAA